jgi:hypothetical protein
MTGPGGRERRRVLRANCGHACLGKFTEHPRSLHGCAGPRRHGKHTVGGTDKNRSVPPYQLHHSAMRNGIMQ